MIKGIVAYTAEQTPNSVRLERATAGIKEVAYVSDWDSAASFLTEDKGQALHIVWNLQHFTKILFILLPDTEWVGKETKLIFGTTKIFYVEKMLGIGQKRCIRGNIYEEYENNFYALQHWMPEQDEPQTALELAERGEQVLEALDLLNIYPNKLTSPVGLFSQSLPPMPTLLSSNNEMMVDVANYCAPMMRKEWRETWIEGYFPKLHSYDIVSAYPYFISQLPDTDHCKIEKVTQYPRLTRNQWGIFKGVYKPMGNVNPIKSTEYLTSDEVRWINYWDAGSFETIDGFLLTFLNDKKPYYGTIEQLYSQRQALKENEIATFLAKNIAQGISGKLDQVNDDGTFGEFCNPVYAAMVRSKTRTRLGHYINNWIKQGQIKQSDLVNVNLDEATFRNPVQGFCQPDNLRPGDWRYRVKEGVVA